MRWTLICWLSVALLLAACNLSTSPDSTPTAPATDAPLTVTEQPTRTPVGALPPLAATPTQLFLEQVTSVPVATLNVPQSSEPLPQVTIDAATANDRYEITTRNGQLVGIIYEVTVPSGMSLGLVVQGADGVVWQRTLTADASSREEFRVEQGGVYELLLFRQGNDISYSFSWD